jgi:hypothetical protein
MAYLSKSSKIICYAAMNSRVIIVNLKGSTRNPI